MIIFAATLIAMILMGAILGFALISGKKPVVSCSSVGSKNSNGRGCVTCSTSVKEACQIPDKK